MALKPDLVIMWASQTESIQSIERHGIPVYGVFLKSFDDVYREIRDFGLLTGTIERADSLILYTKNEIGKLEQRLQLSASGKKSIYFTWAQGLLETAGTNSTVNEMIMLAGGVNSCTIEQEHVIINKERLLDWNPDVIVMWYNDARDPDDLINLSEIRNIKAIRNSQVFELPSVFLCDLWTLKFPYAVKMVAKWSYPAIFEDMDLHEEKKNMLIDLYGDKGQYLIN
jgi:iron complex transport system substrate-binding protein